MKPQQILGNNCGLNMKPQYIVREKCVYWGGTITGAVQTSAWFWFNLFDYVDNLHPIDSLSRPIYKQRLELIACSCNVLKISRYTFLRIKLTDLKRRVFNGLRIADAFTQIKNNGMHYRAWSELKAVPLCQKRSSCRRHPSLLFMLKVHINNKYFLPKH